MRSVCGIRPSWKNGPGRGLRLYRPVLYRDDKEPLPSHFAGMLTDGKLHPERPDTCIGQPYIRESIRRPVCDGRYQVAADQPLVFHEDQVFEYVLFTQVLQVFVVYGQNPLL